MHLRPLLQLSFLALLSNVVASERRGIVARQGGYGYGGSGNGGSDDGGPSHSGGSDDDAATTSGSTATASAAQASASSTALIGAVGATTGDQTCGNLMCVTATKNSTHVEYVLSSTGSKTPGWMGVGFGQVMKGATITVMWHNSDGTFTVSQRNGGQGEVEPTLDPSPSRVAAVDNSISVNTAGSEKFAFALPVDSTTTQDIIFAFCSQNPGNSAQGAEIQYHDEHYQATLDLSKALGSNGQPDSSSANDLPLTSRQKMIIAHAILCVIGFLLLLPAGALLARYWRTYSNMWFKGHWVVQVGLAGPIIIIGIALGISYVEQVGAKHLSDSHMKGGIALLVLYVVQCSLGWIIHIIKPKNSMRRPPQNYFHAVLGLTIIALALYQVHSGYDTEYKFAISSPIPNSVHIIWIIWVILLPVLYVAGLAFLPRQFRQEAENRQRQMNKSVTSQPSS